MATYSADMLDENSDLFQEVQSELYARYFIDFDVMWLVQAGVLVFLMHLGFMTLEAGSVRSRNKENIIFKNFLTVSLSAVTYWAWGYGVSYGTGGLSGDSARFIGSGSFGVDPADLDGAATFEDGDFTTLYGQGFYFFQWAFAATAATIVSGAVAGRMRIEAYMLSAVYITSFVYPVVAHWVWGTEGWLSAFSTLPALYAEYFPYSCGMFDFAGSAVVHMTGGVAAFWGALILGPRIDFKDAQGHNLALVFLGTMLLWFGWYGFNCGSTLVFDGLNVGKVAVTTTLAPGAAVIVGMAVLKMKTGNWDLVNSLNCALAGLVSVTANCILVEDWGAIAVGAIGAIIYIYSSAYLKSKDIDDPVGAIAVHGFCGAWGAIAVAIFGTPQAVAAGYSCSEDFTDFVNAKYIEDPSSFYTFSMLPGYQMAIQVTGVVAIIAWVSLTTAPFFLLLKKIGLLRVSEADEMAGLDISEHGGMETAALKVEEEVKPVEEEEAAEAPASEA